MDGDFYEVSLNKTVLVSVIMGVCHPEEDTSLLERSVLSVLEQSFCDYEFIICENGSSINAINLLKSYSTKTDIVKLYLNDQQNSS